MKQYISLSIIICAILIGPFAIIDEYAFGVSIKSGHRPADVNVQYCVGRDESDDGMKLHSSYPTKLDPRNDKWFNGLKVKDQLETGLCWSCAAASAAEISYAKETGKNVDQVSPVHLGYFFYNRINDPLGNTQYDINNVVGYGSDRMFNWYEAGGNMAYTMQHLATWSGMAKEELMPFNEISSKYNLQLAYQNYIVEQNSTYYEEPTIEKIKSLVSEYGAVVGSLEFNDLCLHDVSFYNYKGNCFNDHEIVIVGWDDDYNKNNFRSTNMRGEIFEPEQNGAWIGLNSWGDTWGDNGFFYISYESNDLYSDGVCSLDMQPADTHDFIFQYDGNANCSSRLMSQGQKAANIYYAPAKKQVLLSGVGFTTWNENISGETEYEVDIYTGVDPDKGPESGFKAYSTTVRTDTVGYKSFDFPEKKCVSIDAGEAFSIVITFKDRTWFGTEESDSEGFFIAECQEGQCYRYKPAGSSWIDTSMSRYSFRIKGLAEEYNCAHDYGVVSVIKPTYTKGGYTIYKCTKCGHNHKGSVKGKLKPIIPKTTLIRSLKSEKNTLVVEWKKQANKFSGKRITGYQIRYSTSNSFKSVKQVKIKGYKKTSKKITGLKKGKRYYIQIRTYITNCGRTFWSTWSKKKTILYNG